MRPLMGSSMKQKAFGGWVKDIKPVTLGEHYHLDDFSSRLNPKHIRYFEDYRTRYFFDRLVCGQGMENCFYMLKKCVDLPANWIDLGASVTTLFWSIGFNTKHLKTIEVCDIMPEALHVLRSFKETQQIPGCYLDAMRLTGKPREEFNTLRNAPWTYHIFDCLGKWPSFFDSNRYELITVIGCFGLSSDAEHYQNVFANAASHLIAGGTIVGVDWVRSECFIKEEKHDNTYLNSELILQSGTRHGLINRHIELINIHNDLYYDEAIIWAFQRP